MPRYRFVTADDQVFESRATPAKIARMHPGSRITHRVEAQPNGESALVPYQGEQRMEPEVAETEESAVVVTEAGPLKTEKTRGTRKR